MPRPSALSCCVLLSVFASAACAAELNPEWPRFRGPTAMGVADDDPRLPDTWSKTDNVRWATDIPGLGWSSPIVAAGKVFLTTVTSESQYEKPTKGLYQGLGRPGPPKGIHRWVIYCLDLETGKVLWQQEAHQGEPQSPRHPKSTYVIEAGPEFKVARTNRLEEMCMASPAIANGKLVLRTASKVYCLGTQ